MAEPLTEASTTTSENPNTLNPSNNETTTTTTTQSPPDIQSRSSGSQRHQQPPIISNKNITLQSHSFDPIDEFNMKNCEECDREFLRSYLHRNFSAKICDDCRDQKGAHELITRTDAKNKYLLKDCDFDLRQPPLKYILKKNPYANRGDMRLYLKFQIEERAIQVHGSEEQLESELEKREERRGIKKQKVYNKRMKDLNMNVRSSLYKRKTVDVHDHEFGEPVCIDKDNDMYKKECKICGHSIEYEEM